MKNKNTLIGCAILVSTFFLLAIIVAMATHRFSSNPSVRTSGIPRWRHVTSGGDRIGLVQIDGIIRSGGSATGFMSGDDAGSDSIVRILEEAGKDDGIKIIVIRVNSPGGSAAASQEIYNEIMRVKRLYNKKVIVSMADVAASGGYYLSSAADVIFSNPATFTGSIGVIMEYMNYGGLLQRYDVKPVVLKSGSHKDMGSPYRDLTPEELKIMQGVMDSVHEQFIRDVAAGRKMPYEKVKELADGRVYSGEQAAKLGLVDRIGGIQDTLRYAAKIAKLGDDPEVENLNNGNPLKMLLRSQSRFPDIERGLSQLTQFLLVAPHLADK